MAQYRGPHPLALPLADLGFTRRYPLYRSDAFALGHTLNRPSLTNFDPDPGPAFEGLNEYPMNTRHLFVGPSRFDTFRTEIRQLLNGGKLKSICVPFGAI